MHAQPVRQAFASTRVLAHVQPHPATYNRRMPMAPIPDLVADLAAGRMVILIDEEDRENEGDLILAADHVSADGINFMAKHARGLICLTLTRERCERLQLPPMAARNGTAHGTAFTVSIEAASGVTTGISAADRAHTIRAAVAREARATDLVQPGHVFPLQAQDGGVLMRAGHTEAGCDLAGMAGLTPAAVICEIMNDDGSMARLPDLEVFAQAHGLKIGTIADLIAFRSHNESLIERCGERELVTPYGGFRCITYRDRGRGLHLALSHGRWQRSDEVLVRVHEPFTAMDLLDVVRRQPFVAAGARVASAAAQPARRGRAAQLHGRRGHAAVAVPAASRARATRHAVGRWTCARTASARRSCAISASRACACSAARGACPAWPATGSR